MYSKQLTIEGQTVEVSRSTNLTSMVYDALLARFAAFYVELAAEIGAEPQHVDSVLTNLAVVAAQTKGYSKLPTLADTPDEMRSKCKLWLTDSNPKIAKLLTASVDAADASWGEIAEGPLPLTDEQKKTDPT